MGNGNEFNEAGIEKALGDLPRAEAPVNFEAMVRSRIAESDQQASWRPGWALGLKFAMPTMALLLLGAFFVFSGGSTMNDLPVLAVNGQTEIDSGHAVMPDAPGPVSESLKKKDQLATKGVNGQQNTKVILPDGKVLRPNEQGGGSEDKTVDQADPAIYPEGLDPNKKPDVRNIKPPTNNGISAEAILSMLGVKSECKQNGCVATAVAKQSIAERAGVKANDLIEAIDDKPVKAGTTFEGTINVRTLRVVRGGKRITIDLNAKKS